MIIVEELSLSDIKVKINVRKTICKVMLDKIDRGDP